MKDSEHIFAIGDIHGCAEEFQALIDKLPLSFDSQIVLLGDYIDRGPKSRQVIDLIRNLQRHYKVTALKGNHEQMLLTFLFEPHSTDAGMFIFNGGSATLASYGNDDGVFEIPTSHIEFFKNLPAFYQTEEFFFVHAGVPPGRSLSAINETDDQMHLLWIRDSFLKSTHHWEKIIVHGHTPVQAAQVKENRINLDTGCVYGGKLTAIELPSRRLYQVKKGAKAERTFLRKKYQDSRIAARFTGLIPVEVELGLSKLVFETLNYNEFGLLIREVEAGCPELKIGTSITCRIGVDQHNSVRFSGVIIRSEVRYQARCYGVRLF